MPVWISKSIRKNEKNKGSCIPYSVCHEKIKENITHWKLFKNLYIHGNKTGEGFIEFKFAFSFSFNFSFLFFSFLSLTFFIIQIELSNVIHRILAICDGFIAFQVSIEHATKVLWASFSLKNISYENSSFRNIMMVRS